MGGDYLVESSLRKEEDKQEFSDYHLVERQSGKHLKEETMCHTQEGAVTSSLPALCRLPEPYSFMS